MVSQTADRPPPSNANPPEEAGARDASGEWNRANPGGRRGGVRRLVASTVRLADLQIRIWLTQAKITVARVATFLILCAAAGVMAILGTIFLLIGLFRILTDEFGLQPVWAFLIFGGFLFVMAGVVVIMARQTLRTKAGPRNNAA
ncbi:MAG TPA: phage holin family protein [Phycisphaerae bacterium]|nr:phage holin family protein [Phycisphaerae bacterium]